MKKRGLYHKIAKFYDLLDYPLELAYYRYMRDYWIGRLDKEIILEIGVGTGKNLKYYRNSNTIVAIDKEIQMLNQAKKKLRSNKQDNSNVHLLLQDTLPWKLPIKKFSIVIASFVFCTMTNPKTVLDELLKWTKSGSKLILFEYIHPGTGIMQSITKILNPITLKLFGVNFNRKPSSQYLDTNWKLSKITQIVPNWIVVVEIERA